MLSEDFFTRIQDPVLSGTVRAIAQKIQAAGGHAFVVGGAVRDCLLGTSLKDVDLEVFGLEPNRLQVILRKDYPFDPCGLSFGVLKVQHCNLDIALPRRESKCGLGHRGFLIDSDPFLSVREAAARRDFTINAIYLDPLTGTIEDPFGGMRDIAQHVLRPVSEHFVEDPLRVLRGMQFIARFSLSPAPEAIALCRKMDIEGLPPERLFGEWEKFFTKGVALKSGLEFLRQTGWVRFFPELQRLIGCRQDPKWHPEGDVWNHTCLCLDAFARQRLNDPTEDLIVGLAVLCHDFGKPAATRFLRGRYRSPGHDAKGLAPTLSFLQRLTNEERILNEVPPLVTCHMQPFSLWRGHAGDAAIRRLALRVRRIDRLIRVCRADDEGRFWEPGPNDKTGQELDWLAHAAERLRLAAEAPKPIFQGRHLIELGYRPSPRFGVLLKQVFEAQLEGCFSDLEGARKYFLTHIKEHQE